MANLQTLQYEDDIFQYTAASTGAITAPDSTAGFRFSWERQSQRIYLEIEPPTAVATVAATTTVSITPLLPTSARPPRTISFPVVFNNAGTNLAGVVTIATSGQVTYTAATAFTGGSYVLMATTLAVSYSAK